MKMPITGGQPGGRFSWFDIKLGVAENYYLETIDQWGRTTSRKGFTDGPGGPTVVEEKYEYDLAGSLTRLTDANNNATQYAYDALNRLNKVTNPLVEATDYDYDRLGDLTQTIQYHGATAFPTVNQYSERGALVSKQLPAGVSPSLFSPAQPVAPPSVTFYVKDCEIHLNDVELRSR